MDHLEFIHTCFECLVMIFGGSLLGICLVWCYLRITTK